MRASPSKPALAVAVFGFVHHWNDFMFHLHPVARRRLALELNSFRSCTALSHLMMAAAVTVLIPVLVIFFIAQRYFVSGIIMSGIKG